MRLTKKAAAIGGLAVVVVVVALFLALPPLVRHVAVQKIEEATGRTTQIADVSFNPFTLRAGISGFRLAEKGSQATFASFSSVRVSLSPLSLPKRSFIVKEIQVSSPYLHLVRTAPNTFNFSDLVTPKKETKKEESYLFSLNNITVKNGALDFEDRALAAPKDHTLRGLTLAIPFFSNIPYLADRYVMPHFSAQVNGTPIALNGRLKPMTRAVEASIDLKVQSLDIPFYLGYLPFPPPVKVDSGRLTTALELGYRVDAKTGPEATLAGSVALDRVSVREPGGARLAGLKRGELKIAKGELLARRFDLEALSLEGPEVFASRDAAGRWNFQKLTAPQDQRPTAGGTGANGPKGVKKGNQEGEPPGDGKAKESKEAEAGKGASEGKQGKQAVVRLARLSLSGGAVHVVDATPRGGFRTDIKDLKISLANFSSKGGLKSPFGLELGTGRGEHLEVKGELVPDPLEVRAGVTLSAVPLKDYYPYLSDTLASPITGTLGARAELFYNATKGLIIEKTSVRGDNLAASFGSGEGVRLKQALINDIGVGLNERKARVGSVELKGGNVALSREEGGAISATHLVKAGPAKPAPAPPTKGAAKKGKEPAAPSFSYRIDKIAGSDLGVRFTDRSREDAPVFTLSRLNFTLTGITGPRQGAIPFKLASGYGGKGRLSAAGNLTPSPLRLKGNLRLERIPLRDFDAYLPEGTEIFLADGALDTQLSLDLEQARSELRGSFAGSLGVHSFYCQDTVYDEDLLKWDSLELDQVSGTLAPFSLAIKDVSLSNFYARVIVEPDGTLNLQHLVRSEPPAASSTTPASATATAPPGPPAAKTQPTPATAPVQPTPAAAPAQPAPARMAAPAKATAPKAPSPAATASASATSPAQPHPVRIETVTMQGGTLNFSDRHLKYPFDTTFFNLGGRVSGLTSEANRAADVDLRGNLENHSPLSITGTINPLRGDLYLDLKIAFTDIELSPFTPYANTYLGYSIDKGKLNLDLAYKIDKKALTSKNKLFIDQFTFGKQVESDKATKLPVRLAIALLKDRKGEIHLDLPVAGQTDDPKFSVWKVVLQVLKNLLVKAATSPFALLGSLFGGGEDFSAVTFLPGSATLSKPEEAKLAKLSQALQDRPALNLEISGFVDRDRDPEGYRNELLLRKMKGEKFRTLVKQGKSREGESPEALEITPQEYPVYLKAVYAKEKFPKPRNVLGMAKDLPEAEMKKLILTHTVVGKNELEALARERAEAVRDYLLKAGKLPPQRLFEKNADIFKPPAREGSTPSRVEFGALVK